MSLKNNNRVGSDKEKMMWIEGGIVFLLIMSILLCYRLSKKLQTVNDLTSKLTPTIDGLGQILHNATHSIGILKQTADTGQKCLTTSIPSAYAVGSDLLLLIEHADKLTYQLDELIKKADIIDKDLRLTIMTTIKESEKQKIEFPIEGDSRELFVHRVIAKYQNEGNGNYQEC